MAGRWCRANHPTQQKPDGQVPGTAPLFVPDHDEEAAW